MLGTRGCRCVRLGLSLPSHAEDQVRRCSGGWRGVRRLPGEVSERPCKGPRGRHASRAPNCSKYAYSVGIFVFRDAGRRRRRWNRRAGNHAGERVSACARLQLRLRLPLSAASGAPSPSSRVRRGGKPFAAVGYPEVVALQRLRPAGTSLLTSRSGLKKCLGSATLIRPLRGAVSGRAETKKVAKLVKKLRLKRKLVEEILEDAGIWRLVWADWSESWLIPVASGRG